VLGSSASGVEAGAEAGLRARQGSARSTRGVARRLGGAPWWGSGTAALSGARDAWVCEWEGGGARGGPRCSNDREGRRFRLWRTTWVRPSRRACGWRGEGGYAGTRELTGGPTVSGPAPARGQRPGGGDAPTCGAQGQRERAGAWLRAAHRQGRPAGQREKRGEVAGAAVMGRLGRKAKGGRGRGPLSFFFYFYILISFSFLFSLLGSNSNMPQIQISTPQAYASNKSEV
jgi:hypothetical protein